MIERCQNQLGWGTGLFALQTYLVYLVKVHYPKETNARTTLPMGLVSDLLSFFVMSQGLDLYPLIDLEVTI